MREKKVKVTIVGDGCVGKTCLLVSYVHKQFPEKHVPTVFDMTDAPDPIILGDTAYHLTLWDTAGQEDYERLRPMSYPGTDVIILCYSVDSTASFANVHLKWIPELKHHVPAVPIVLVGTKQDKRPAVPATTKMVSNKEGQALRKKIKAAGFIECSALTRDNIEEVFVLAVKALDPDRAKTSFCCLL